MIANTNRLLIVEDDPGLLRQYRWLFDGYELHTATNQHEAVTQLKQHEPSVVLLDLGLPPDADGIDEGLATLCELLKLDSYVKIIVATGRGDHDTAVRCVGLGAHDFYHKPVDPDILELIVARALRMYALEQDNLRLVPQDDTFAGIVGSSDAIMRVCRQIEKVAPAQATVLVLGETGTGKELLARAIHTLSTRAAHSFVAINCAAIPEALLESELFGHEKGAFTGAIARKQGRIEDAQGGTLFLDEIGDLPIGLQSKLLRFLQERILERVGGRRGIPVDTRIVCATNRDLPALIKRDQFREDLYYRVSEITIQVPSLRERAGDAVLLANALLKQHSLRSGRSLLGFSEDALDAIKNYAWPGNIRELQNKIKSAVLMAEGKRVTARELGIEAPRDEPSSLDLRLVRDKAEYGALRKALERANGNLSKAAKILSVSRPTLYDLLRKHGLDEAI